MSKKQAKVPTLDLHGYTESEVYDAIDSFLRKHDNKNKVHIMTGKGKGIVKKKTKEYLKLAGYPATPLKMDNGKANEGVLVIHMN